MQVNSITSRAAATLQGGDVFSKVKQSFQNLGSALESGNLSDAQAALAQLQKNAPARANDDNNPMKAKMEALSQAVESGDLKAAQEAYADVKKTMAHRPAGGPQGGGGAGGPPPGGAPPSGGGQVSGAGGSTASNKTYDVKDTNKDGTVSWKEEQDYKLKHPEAATETTPPATVDSDRGLIDALA